MKKITSYLEKSNQIPIAHDVDVLVAGGGCAGTMAAIACARAGLDTLLVERYGFLGGAATTQYVPLLSIWNTSPWADEKKPLIGGLVQEICTRLDDVGGSVKAEKAYKAQKNGDFPSIWFHLDFELTKLVKQKMCEEAGVKFLLHSYIADAIVEDNKVKGLLVENKSGRQALMAKIVIDCTGDGDVAARANAEFELEKGSNIVDNTEFGVMAVSFVTKLTNINKEALKAAEENNPTLVLDLMKKIAPELIAKRIETFPPYADKSRVYPHHPGKLPEPYQSDPKYYAVTRPGEGRGFFLHSYGCNITDAADITSAEVELRARILPLLKFFKENVPGYEECYISTTATQLGLRESRHITGDYILTESDMLTGSTFDDVILRDRIGEWDIDKDGKLKDSSELSPPFDIPYRCIVPKKVDGLLIAGRCISIAHKAAYYFTPRDIVTAWGLGEAAGTAASLCVKEGIQPRELNVKQLQVQLEKQGFNLG